ncbi:MAG: SET domain-containing protein-lysine N-methyltransferase [Gammaproteobacteria bacterium]|nr:SET domain-containing protein-lysine N-methyltransferase [Gammaproteobacteria bacterium]
MTDDESLSKLFYVADSPLHGQGLFARKGVAKGRYLGSYAGPKTRRNGMYVLWVEESEGEWIGCNGKNLLRYINHSTKPCAEFDGLDLYACKRIKKDQEITINYGDESGLD